jgi:hypothetical protein
LDFGFEMQESSDFTIPHLHQSQGDSITRPVR